MLVSLNRPPLFEISADDIARLGEDAFVDFVNRLLRTEGHRVGIPPTNIQTSLRVNDPDGGIDALITNASAHLSRIPVGTSVWQFKKGDCSPNKIKTEEFPKPDVQETISNSGAYCFVIGEDITPVKTRNRKTALTQCFDSLNIPDRSELFTASHLAEWASEFPAMAFLPYFQRPVNADFMRWEIWEQLQPFRTPFRSDQQRETIIIEVRNHLSRQTDLLHCRIEGLTGIGKTRLALECCRQIGLQEQVLYAESPTQIPSGLFHWLENQSKTSAILVIDECNRDEADRLSRQVQRCNGRVRLLTIGIAQETYTNYPLGVLFLHKLDDEAMRLLLQRVFPRQPFETVDFIIRVASGYVKLATAIGMAIERDPRNISIQDLARSYDVNIILDRFVVPDETNRRIMQGIALLNRIGWDDDLSPQGEAVMTFLGLRDRTDVRMRVGQLVREGLIAKQGRYRYVTPHLLAVWLASQVWSDLGDETVSLFNVLPDWDARNAFLMRLRDLGDEPAAQQVCGFLLSSEGLFPDLESLNDHAKAQIFAILSDAHPEAGLRALERIISHLPRDRLLQFGEGRRHVIWTLEKLAWQTATFFGAARLLLQLAEAENEVRIANNATGVWVSLFGTRLGNTAVPAIERHRLLREALEHSSEGRQLLAVQAVGRAIQLFEMGTSFSSNAPRVPPLRWHPTTHAEDREARRSALLLLDQAMASTVTQVRETAVETLVNSIRDLVRAGLAADVIERLRNLSVNTEEQKRHLRDIVGQLLSFEAANLQPDHQEFFTTLQHELAGQSFGERLRRWVGEWTLTDRPLPLPDSLQQARLESPNPEQMVVSLAEEVMANPELLTPELNWLSSEDAKHGFIFARRLGELDQEIRFWNELESLIERPNSMLLTSAYLRGHVEAGRRAWRDAILDEWIEQETKARPLLDAIWRSEPDDDDAYRLIKVIEKGWLNANEVSILTYGGRTESFSEPVFHKFLESLINDHHEHGAHGVLSLLHQRLRFYPGEITSLEDLAWQILETGVPPRSQTMGEFDWIQLARAYLSKDPIRILKIFLATFETDSSPIIKNDSLTPVLVEVTRIEPRGVWQEVSIVLLKQSNYRLSLYLRGWYAELFDPELLLSWAIENLPLGPQIVAELTPVENKPLLPLARELLIRFSHDPDVSSTLYATLMTGTFMGPASNWLNEKLRAVKEWIHDPNENVRSWSQAVLESLEVRIRQASLEEEEFNF